MSTEFDAAFLESETALRTPPPAVHIEPSDNGQHDDSPEIPSDDSPLARMPAAVKEEARLMLEDSSLMVRIMEDINAVGIAGEMELSLTIYIVGTSRLLGRPLSAIIQGPSSSGKSYTLEKVSTMFPEESKVVAQQLSPQSLFHMQPGSLRNRWVVAGERSRVENDDKAEATRALREMLSSGRLCKLIATKVGKGIETVLIEQEGPIAFTETTTLGAGSIFDEDLNRCLLLTTDEQPKQTRRIVNSVAKAWSGEEPGAVERIVQRHHALQRMLQPWPVTIPFSHQLAARFPSDRVEARRSFPMVMQTIAAVCLLHQRQRQVDEQGRLIATTQDYIHARQLIGRAVSRSVGKGCSDACLRFLARLAPRMGDEEFTVAQASKGDEASTSSVYSWVRELVESGAVEQTAEKAGPKAAKYRLTGDQPRTGEVLPTLEELD